MKPLVTIKIPIKASKDYAVRGEYIKKRDICTPKSYQIGDVVPLGRLYTSSEPEEKRKQRYGTVIAVFPHYVVCDTGNYTECVNI